MLNCSKANPMFHPTTAMMEVNGFYQSIDYHANMAKRIVKEGYVVAPLNPKEAKEYPLAGVVVEGYLLPASYYEQYVAFLWYHYLSHRPQLIEELTGKTRFRDYGQHEDIAHATFIANYAGFAQAENKAGAKPKATRGDLLCGRFASLSLILNKKQAVLFEKQEPLTTSINEIVGFFVRTDEALQPEMKQLYKRYCDVPFKTLVQKLKHEPESIRSACLVRKNDIRPWARYRTQQRYDKRSTLQRVAFLAFESDKLDLSYRQSLHALKTYAQKHNLAVSLPYDLGCAVIEGEQWRARYAMVEQIFKDYYVTLHHVIEAAHEQAENRTKAGE